MFPPPSFGSSSSAGSGFSLSGTTDTFGFGFRDSSQSSPSRSAKSTVTTPVNEDQIHTDIKLKPNNGPCISAHKSLLAARSEIFKNILNSDDCKAPLTDTDTITLSELSTEELKSFLEFLYTGDLPADKFKKHVYALCVAADKYEIPYLQESCERYMLNSLNASNALDFLDISNLHSKKKLKETTLNFIVRNMKSIVLSQKYEEFAFSNPHLSLEVTRAFAEVRPDNGSGHLAWFENSPKFEKNVDSEYSARNLVKIRSKNRHRLR
ncbi:BTB/POZ domain-containing protein At3g56230-like isoform X4 [Gossypium arboreum]|uniref:BTB/POZ domain-containing protein At3g56230-like isoform X4 n=1 Tax=Gossypium arboreum TaxID=29729 RepID=UPI0022F14837|nr:BTB/POZ domain-containing protein At3g56230-like isoform X4 [Gossypium arboreum]